MKKNIHRYRSSKFWNEFESLAMSSQMKRWMWVEVQSTRVYSNQMLIAISNIVLECLLSSQLFNQNQWHYCFQWKYLISGVFTCSILAYAYRTMTTSTHSHLIAKSHSELHHHLGTICSIEVQMHHPINFPWSLSRAGGGEHSVKIWDFFLTCKQLL